MFDLPVLPAPRHALAVQIAVEAGRQVHAAISRASIVKDEASREIVTEADQLAERMITEAVRHVFPDDAVLGEENGLSVGRSGYTWVIDPIDGTTNFANRIPAYCVSIGVLEDGRPHVGVAYDPTRDELFHAVCGHGAFRDDVRIYVRTVPLTEYSLFGYSSRFIGAAPPHILAMLERFDEYRNFGSAVLHLCYTACGWLAGAFADSTKLWDIAAGGLILQEAGGQIMDFSLDPLFPLAHDLSHYEKTFLPFVATGGCADLTPLCGIFGR